jgi:RsmE family RNA methyltransferase
MLFPTRGQTTGSCLLCRGRRFHGQGQEQRHHRHGWITAATASFVVASLQAESSLAFASFSAMPSVRKVDMMTRRNLSSSTTAVLLSGCGRSPITGWFPLSKERQSPVARHKSFESSLKGHHNDNHGSKRHSSSATGDGSKDYNKWPRLYVGDRHSTSGNALLFTADNWKTTSLYELLLQASRADNQQPAPQQQRSLLLTQGTTLSLSADQSHYLTTVLRLNKKKSTKITNPTLVRIFDETGEWLAEVEPIMSVENSKKKNPIVSVTCLQPLRQGQRPVNNISSICWMAVALPKKKDRSRWLIEKCTELGVAGFILLDTEYSESSGDHAEATTVSSKLSTYAMEAAEQSERLDLPSFVTLLDTLDNKENISSPGNQNQASATGNEVGTTKLTTLLDVWLGDHQNDKNDDENGDSPVPSEKPFLLACRERIGHSEAVVKVIREQVLNQLPSTSTTTECGKQQQSHITLFLVGPEGGWSPAEQARFDRLQQEEQSNTNAVADGSGSERKLFMWNVSLGPNILRAETAAVTAAAAHALVIDEFDSDTPVIV